MKQWSRPVLKMLNALSALKRGEAVAIEDMVKAYRAYHQSQSKAFSQKEDKLEQEERAESFRSLLESRESCLVTLESGTIVDADQLYLLEEELASHREKPKLTSADISINDATRKSYDEFDSFLTELSQRDLSYENFIGTREASLVETLRGIYGGTQPELSVISICAFLGNSPLVSIYEDIFTELESFLSTGEKGYLFNACERYLSTLPKQAVGSSPESSGVLCTFCSAPNEAARATCIQCGARLMFRDSIMQSVQIYDEERVPENIAGLPLPPVAEPLVSLLTRVEKGAYSEEDVYLTLERLDIALNQTLQHLEHDKTLPKGQRESMRAVLDQFFKARDEAGHFLESYDTAVLRRAIKFFSDASVNAKKTTGSADESFI